MSRTARLFDLLQLLREHRYPVSGQVLAGRLDISLRTLYRDIAELKAQGAAIGGEPGLGFVLRPGFMLPPLMFSEQEIEALVLGATWVAQRTDDELAQAGRGALAKIAAVLPGDILDALEHSGLLVGPVADDDILEETNDFLPEIRRAIRHEFKLDIDYFDASGRPSTRTIWPVALSFFERSRLVVAWCEMRGDFRHFRTDRIVSLACAEMRYPKRRAVLLKEWRRQEKERATLNDADKS